MRRSLRKLKKTQQQHNQNQVMHDSKTVLDLTQNFPTTNPPKRTLKSSQLNRLLANREHMQSVQSQRVLESSINVKDRFRDICRESVEVRELIREYGISQGHLSQIQHVVSSKYCNQGEEIGFEDLVIEALKKKVGIIQCQAACRQKQTYISSLFDQRIQRLQTLINKK